MNGAIPLVPIYAFMAWTETNLSSFAFIHKTNRLDEGKG
jgi:hypothetical protein